MNHAKAIATCLVMLGWVVRAQAQPQATSPAQLGRMIEGYVTQEAYENAIWAAYVMNLNTGDVLYQRNARMSLLPASNAKLFTVAAVLEQLGPDFRYTTRLYAGGPVEEGIVRGDLLVRGDGDPSIGERFEQGDITRTFRAWARELRDEGIRAIEGDIVGDDDIFDDAPFGPGWSWDDEPYDYGAEISGLTFNENTIRMVMRGGVAGRPADISWEPSTTYVQLHNAARIIPAEARKDEEIERDRASNRFTIATELPAGRIDTTWLAVANPTLYFVHVLKEVLVQEGIEVLGQPADIDEGRLAPDYSRMTPLLEHVSPPLSEIVEVLNKESQNLYAEQVLRTLGVVHPVADPDIDPGSTEMGAEAALATYGRAGADTSRIQLVDGSGLSRMNLVTAEMTARVLSYMWHHADNAVRTAFMASLPVGGVNGTLENRMRNGPAAGNVLAKTGTLTGVSNLSGYVTSAGGTPLLFVLMCNNHTLRTREVNRTQDAIVQLLARYGN